jgi:hypothetical protein
VIGNGTSSNPESMSLNTTAREVDSLQQPYRSPSMEKSTKCYQQRVANNETGNNAGNGGGGGSRFFMFSLSQSRYNTRITFMLIVLNISFCLFSMPIVILQIIHFRIIQASYSSSVENGAAHITCSSSYNSTNLSTTNPSGEQSPGFDFQLEFIKSIAELLQYLNHSTNFFLYSFSGKTFRDETKSFLKYHYKRVMSLCGGEFTAADRVRSHKNFNNSLYTSHRFNFDVNSSILKRGDSQKESLRAARNIPFETRNSMRSTIKR